LISDWFDVFPFWMKGRQPGDPDDEEEEDDEGKQAEDQHRHGERVEIEPEEVGQVVQLLLSVQLALTALL